MTYAAGTPGLAGLEAASPLQIPRGPPFGSRSARATLARVAPQWVLR